MDLDQNRSYHINYSSYILKKNIIEEDSEESEEEIIKPVKAKFKSQQNKKSVIKVTENNKTFPQYKNYFCD